MIVTITTFLVVFKFEFDHEFHVRFYVTKMHIF